MIRIFLGGTLGFVRILLNLSVAAILTSGASPLARASVSNPTRDWREIEVGSFALIFDAAHQEVAEVYAARLNRLEKELFPLWKSVPRRIVVVLNDKTDVTNGYATHLPRPLIMIYPVLPSPSDSIGSFDDWAWELMVHEAVHILGFEQRRGVVTGLATIFGPIMSPNSLLPRWWSEGVAVEFETRLSRAGRLRSWQQASVLRAMEVEDRWREHPYGAMNETSIPIWPFGNRPYLFGSVVWSEMTARKGAELAGRLHYRTGGRVPYLLETPVQEELDGKTPEQLYRESIEQLRAEIQKQLKVLQELPTSKLEDFDPGLRESLGARISQDGLHLALLGKDDTLRRRLQVYTRPDTQSPFLRTQRRMIFGKDEDLVPEDRSTLPGNQHGPGDDGPPGGNILRMDWHPKKDIILHDRITEVSRFEDRSELWTFDLSTGRSEKLPTQGRLREAAFDPLGERIAAVHLQPGKTELVVLEYPSGKELYRRSSRPQARVSQPVWLTNQEVLFAERWEGREFAHVVNLVSGKEMQVLENFESPHQFDIPPSRDRLLFVSTANGVSNLYESDLSLEAVHPLTHVTTGVLGGTMDPVQGNYWITRMSSEGWRTAQLPKLEAAQRRGRLPKIERLWMDRYPNAENTTAPMGSVGLASASSYSGVSYLWPRYWLPLVFAGNLGWIASVQTGGQDPLGQHAYSLQGIYDSVSQATSFLGTYVNQMWKPTWTFTTANVTTRLASTGLTSRVHLNQVTVSRELEGWDPDWILFGGALSLYREREGRSSDQVGPLFGFLYSNTARTGWQISPEAGHDLQWTFSVREDRVTRRRNASLQGAATKYLTSKFLPERHVLMSKFSGRWSDEPLTVESLESNTAELTTTQTPAGVFLTRGYLTGAFLGRTMANLNLEYRFPLSRLDRAPNAPPIYLHRWHAAWVFDSLWMEGFAYLKREDKFAYERVEGNRVFPSTGVEFRLETNVGYHIPMTLIGGVYAPLDREANTGPQFGVGIQL